MRRLFTVLFGLAVLGAPAAAEDHLDGRTLRKMEEFGVRWWKARPKTKFGSWDFQTRENLLKEARAFGKIPEGSLEEVRDVLFKSLRRYGPRAKGRGNKHIIETPYGEAWFYVKEAGRHKGLVVGLHGGGVGAGSADEPAGTWHVKGCMGMYPQAIRLVHDAWNTVHGEKFVLTLIEIAKAQYDIDPDRVYVMGFSMGGTGSWHMAGRWPDLFAAASPCAGVLMAAPKSQVPKKEDVESLQYGLVPNVRNLPMYSFIGLADDHCMPGTFLYVWDRIQELRKADPGGYTHFHFQTYPGLGHAFPPGEPSKDLAWIAKQTRDSYPRKLVWEYAANPYPLPVPEDKTKRAQKHFFYWIEDDRPEDRMYLEAKRDGNKIDVSLGGADPGPISILLNPKMIDVKKDVVVSVDGKEVYRGKPQPDFLTVLLTLDSKLDKTLTFDRRISLAPPSH